MKEKEYYTYLLLGYMNGTASEAEQADLFEELDKQQDAAAWAGIIEEIMAKAAIDLTYDPARWEATINRILSGEKEQTVAPVHRVHFLKTSWFRYAAAVILLVGGAAVWYDLSQRPQSSSSPQAGISQSTNNDIAPGTNRAILTVGNKNFDLATNKTGIAVGNVITYNDGERIADAGQQLALTTPKGGQYQATLPDGSKVWLNAASSIRFPSRFTGNTREVEITGEAYLEIAKNSKQPFYVHTNKTTVQVLGTSFNVNAYANEEVERTTLIEGSVKVISASYSVISSDSEKSLRMPTGSKQGDFSLRSAPFEMTGRQGAAGAGVILKPNQQAELTNTNTIKVNNNTNTDEVLAWKNGFFNFNNADLPSVMRQLERWYDITVKYEGKIPAIKFKGKLDRGVNLSDILAILTEMNVNYTVQDRILTIRP